MKYLGAIVFTFVLSLAAWTFPGHAGEWTRFRGSDGSAVSSEPVLPRKWSDKENIRWKIELPGRGVSAPVIAGGRIYVTACTSYKERRLHVLCLDQANGQKLWERQFSATGNTMCHPATCMAAPTPATDGERVYALFATGDLACLDRDGNLLWYRSLVGDYPTITNQVGAAASPILHEGVLLVPAENEGESFAAGIDKMTGENIWKVSRTRGINWVTPQLYQGANGVEVLFQTGSEATSIEPATGRVLWSYKGRCSQVVSPLVHSRTVVIPGGEFVAVQPDAADSSVKTLWQSSRLRVSYASAVIYEDRIYVINDVGVLISADVRTGKMIAQERILPGPFWASPVAGAGLLYLLNEKGATAVVQAGDKPRLLATNKLDDKFLATPAIADGTLYLRSDRYLYAIAEQRK